MSNLYQLYALVTAKYWEIHLIDRWPDAPLVNSYRVLVFTNLDYPVLKQQYSNFEAKELTADKTIDALKKNEHGPFVCNLEDLKKVIQHLNPPQEEA